MFDVTIGRAEGIPVYLDSKGKAVEFPPFSSTRSTVKSSDNRRKIRAAIQCGNWKKLEEI